MKFGKHLKFHAVQNWRHKYIKYKKLKRIIKEIEQVLLNERLENDISAHSNEEGLDQDEDRQPLLGGTIVGKIQDDLQLEFFRSLKQEQTKIEDFYAQQLQQLENRFHSLKEQVYQLQTAKVSLLCQFLRV